MSREERAAFDNTRRIEAKRYWDLLDPISVDSPAAAYLRARGLGAFISHPALRAGRRLHEASDKVWPILATRLWHVDHGYSGYQITFLEHDKPDRARAIEPGRMTHGVLKGAAVWIGAPDEEIVVAEGLESLLSALLLLNCRCGAAALGPHLSDIVLPASAQRLHIAADNDDTGRGAAKLAVQVWRKRELSVRVSTPDVEGEDFNDLLRRRA
jgi:hypothetical protein